MKKLKKKIMMKNFKLFLLSFVFIAGILTSCTNDNPVVEEQQNIEESESITTTLERLSEQFNSQGDVLPTENPTGNIVFDFCFDFVYPLDLSYNNGSTVTVENLDDLINVLINSSNNLYVNGISFPFDVETYDDGSDAIVVVTINNEADFIALLEDCDFNTIDPCECYEVYDPVCVEITAPNGETFLMTYPNDCYAACDGFTQNDFAENCEEDYNNPGGTTCFSFNYPLTIITDDGVTVTVNSQTELDNALYNTYYFDFQYPFDVTLEDGTVVTITDVAAFEALLEDCFGNNGQYDCDNQIENVQGSLILCETHTIEIFDPNGNIADVNYVNFNENQQLVVNGTPTVVDTGVWNLMCVENQMILTMSNLGTFTLLNDNWTLIDEIGEYFVFTNDSGYTIHVIFDCNASPCSDCENLPYDPVCVEVQSGGSTETIVFPNACYAECDGYSSEDFVECSGNTTECTTESVLAILFECDWVANNTNTYSFNEDGTVNITGSGLSTVGSWTIFMSNNGYPVVTIEANIGNFGDEWNFIDCNLVNNLTVTSSLNPAGNIVIDCQ